MMKRTLLLALGVLTVLSLGGCRDASQTQSVSPTSIPVAAVLQDVVFVVNGEDNSISILETSSNTVIGTVTLKNVRFPHHISLSGDGSRLALAVPGSDLSGGHGGGHGGMVMDKGSVMVLDARTGATLAPRRFKEMNHNAIFSPGGKEIWTGQMSSPGSVLVLDAETLATIETIPVGNEPAEVTFSPDGKYAFVANGASNSVSVIDVKSRRVVQTLAVGKEPVGAWPGKNGLMYVDNEAGKSLSVIDPQALAVVRTYNLGFTPAMAAIGPDGLLWVTDAENGRIVLYRADQDVMIGKVASGAGSHGIVFSGDGKTAYVTNQGAGTVTVLDVATKKVIATVTVGAKPNGIAWRGR